MRNKIALLFFLPFLVACNRNTYNGPKLLIERDESGKLTETVPLTMKEKVIDERLDCVFYIGDESCSVCKELHPKLIDWVGEKKGKIYYIPLANIDDENIQYIFDATEGYYCWEKSQTVPALYLFKAGEAIFKGDASNGISVLNKYVEIKTGD